LGASQTQRRPRPSPGDPFVSAPIDLAGASVGISGGRPVPPLALGRGPAKPGQAPAVHHGPDRRRRVRASSPAIFPRRSRAGRTERLAGRTERLAGRTERLAGRTERLAGRTERLSVTRPSGTAASGCGVSPTPRQRDVGRRPVAREACLWARG